MQDVERVVRRIVCFVRGHIWRPCRLQPLIGGTSYECRRCHIIQHKD